MCLVKHQEAYLKEDLGASKCGDRGRLGAGAKVTNIGTKTPELKAKELSRPQHAIPVAAPARHVDEAFIRDVFQVAFKVEGLEVVLGVVAQLADVASDVLAGIDDTGDLDRGCAGGACPHFRQGNRGLLFHGDSPVRGIVGTHGTDADDGIRGLVALAGKALDRLLESGADGVHC